MKLIPLLKIARKAGKTILDLYKFDFTTVEHKVDKTPLTLADKRSHEIIYRGLKRLFPDTPLLSEEGEEISYAERKRWRSLWLVDPLDGTKEFINRNGEFTVNIALIEKERPVLGIIYIPQIDIFYYAKMGIGAYKLEGRLLPGSSRDGDIIDGSKRLPVAHPEDRPFTVAGSRSHLSKETEEYIKKLREEFGNMKIIPAGSSIKFCMVAEGKADIYPRFGPTMEWDTAAGQAIVEEAGGMVFDAHTGKELRYNKENLLNPSFIVRMRH